MKKGLAAILVVLGATTVAVTDGRGAWGLPSPSPVPEAKAPAIVGLDHVPIAVSSLEAAAERYRDSSQLVAGRRIVGATVRVKSLASAEALLGSGPLPPGHRVRGSRSSSIFLAPAIAHGLWLELREIH